MISLKISDLLNASDVLQALSKKELKARLALSISRIIKSADAEIANFNETRLALINKYGEKDANGKLITTDDGNCKIPDDVLKTFTDELNDLLDTQVEINANKLTIEELEQMDFTPRDMVLLEPFIEE